MMLACGGEVANPAGPVGEVSRLTVDAAAAADPHRPQIMGGVPRGMAPGAPIWGFAPDGNLQTRRALASGFWVQDLEHFARDPTMPHTRSYAKFLHDADRCQPAQDVGSSR